MYTRLPRGVPRCQHIKVNGTRCDSPALKGKPYCYFHFRSRLNDAPHSPMANSQPPATLPADGRQPRADGPSPLPPPPDLFLLEDANSIQYALQWVLRRILDSSLDRRQAALLLYGLQIAAANLKLLHLEPSYDDVIRTLPATPQALAGTVPEASSCHLERAPSEQTRGESSCHLERAPSEQTRGESKDPASLSPTLSADPQPSASLMVPLPPNNTAEISEPTPAPSKLPTDHCSLATASPQRPPRRPRPTPVLDRRMLASTPRAALSLMFQREVRRHLARLDFPASPESGPET